MRSVRTAARKSVCAAGVSSLSRRARRLLDRRRPRSQGDPARHPHGLQQASRRERLRQDREPAIPSDGAQEAGDAEDGKIGPEHGEHFRELPPADLRHVQVGDHQAQPARVGLDDLQRLLAVARFQHAPTVGLEKATAEPADGLLVIGEQHGAARGWTRGTRGGRRLGPAHGSPGPVLGVAPIFG